MDPGQTLLPVGGGSNAFEQWENLADQSHIPCPATWLQLIIVFQLHLLPCSLPSSNSFLQTSACLAGFLFVCACVCMRKRGGEWSYVWCYVCAKEQDRVCLSEAASLLWCCSWSPNRQMASIWSESCCNSGPGMACYWVSMSKPYFQSDRQLKL